MGPKSITLCNVELLLHRLDVIVPFSKIVSLIFPSVPPTTGCYLQSVRGSFKNGINK